MRILLVTLPWQGLDYPSLAVGILRARAAACKQAHEVREIHAHLRWAEYLLRRTRGRIGPVEYTRVANEGIFYGVGDWIFASALHRTGEWKVEEYQAYLKRNRADLGPIVEMQRYAPGFIEELADEITALQCDVIGLSSTFMQNVPSLSLAAALKRRSGVLVAMGGSNCDGPMGIALHRNFPCVDFVVRGEGEAAFPALLDAIAGERGFETIEGLCWRDASGAVQVNPDRAALFPAEEIPAPDYDAYFEALEASAISDFITPKLPMESSRGCWWGEKHHCTFCGLNGTGMKYRSKSPEKFWDEMVSLIKRYKTLDLTLADNIIDMRYFPELLPRIAASGWDLTIHFEVKSNLSRENIEALRDGQVNHIQPGIESLGTRVLRLMDKGVTGCQNVQTLRECEEHGLTASWNYLYGFPGETERDYADIVDQLPALAHLHPPRSASLIALERFSPNFDRPALGFPVRRPAEFYRYIYDLPERELMDLVYLFDTINQGIAGSDVEKRLTAAVALWRESYQFSELSYRDQGGVIRIRDRRAHWPAADYVLSEPFEVALYRAVQRPQRPSAVVSLLGSEAGTRDVAEHLRAWRRLGLVFEEDGRFVALPYHANPRLLRTISTLHDGGRHGTPEPGFARPQESEV